MRGRLVTTLGLAVVLAAPVPAHARPPRRSTSLTSATTIEVRRNWVSLACGYEYVVRLERRGRVYVGAPQLAVLRGAPVTVRASVTVPRALIVRLARTAIAARRRLAGVTDEPDPRAQPTDAYPAASLRFMMPGGEDVIGLAAQPGSMSWSHGGATALLTHPGPSGDRDAAVVEAFAAVVDAASEAGLHGRVCDGR